MSVGMVPVRGVGVLGCLEGMWGVGVGVGHQETGKLKSVGQETRDWVSKVEFSSLVLLPWHQLAKWLHRGVSENFLAGRVSPGWQRDVCSNKLSMRVLDVSPVMPGCKKTLVPMPVLQIYCPSMYNAFYEIRSRKILPLPSSTSLNLPKNLPPQLWKLNFPPSFSHEIR